MRNYHYTLIFSDKCFILVVVLSKLQVSVMFYLFGILTELFTLQEFSLLIPLFRLKDISE